MSTAYPGQPGNQQTPNQLPKKKSPLLWILLGVGLVLGVPVVCCGGCALLGVGTFNAMKAPMDAATVAVKNDPRVQEKLGTPITGGTRFNVNVASVNGVATATVGFDLQGPEGSAKIDGTMHKPDENWKPQALKVVFNDGSSINLP
jgi:hypothetical protein